MRREYGFLHCKHNLLLLMLLDADADGRTGMLDEALDCLRAFVAQSPPHAVRITLPPEHDGHHEMLLYSL